MTGPLIDWLRRHRLTRPRISRVQLYDSVADVPDRQSRHDLAVVGPPESPKWVAFECPCGHGHKVMVSTQASHEPRWTLIVSPRGPSLQPSIDVRALRRCHFWLQDGRVKWV